MNMNWTYHKAKLPYTTIYRVSGNTIEGYSEFTNRWLGLMNTEDRLERIALADELNEEDVFLMII